MILELRIHIDKQTYYGEADYYVTRLMQLARDDRPLYHQLYSSGQKGKLKTRKGTGLNSLNQPKPACSLFGEVPK